MLKNTNNASCDRDDQKKLGAEGSTQNSSKEIFLTIKETIFEITRETSERIWVYCNWMYRKETFNLIIPPNEILVPWKTDARYYGTDDLSDVILRISFVYKGNQYNIRKDVFQEVVKGGFFESDSPLFFELKNEPLYTFKTADDETF